MKTLDKSTLPWSVIENKNFEWGEPYKVYLPQFIILPFKKENCILEYSIHVFGQNNFKNQLLFIHNKLINHEEKQKIINFKNQKIDREKLINYVSNYLLKNKNLLAPWEKHYDGVTEFDYIAILQEKIDIKINYVIPTL